ncbi:hypothetical protein COV18_01565 [Candidatus Woesearchaeota archaeon CG10_big_fil_rev_8_21_14_0_10_37_12]|nr:MAG: hypothetical protein COV18_01565 [Candidatus Woesearchaeota archaeon CG10_big_fil_rev_8_21_14_0_10_37_12]
MNKISILFLLFLFSCSQPQIVERQTVQCWDGSVTDSLAKCPLQQKFVDAGDFKVSFAVTKKYAELRSVLQEEVFDSTVQLLNSVFILPYDVQIVFSECKEVNAFYFPAQKQVVMCYELMNYFADLFEEFVDSDEEHGRAVLSATYFVFFHELGHAVIDIFNLPVTGKEEDAVDQLATVILAEGSFEMQEAALAGALFFGLSGVETDVQDLAFWDEHSLDLQRFFNVACWVYGSNSDFADPVLDVLPKERAIGCKEEYAQIKYSWFELLKQHMKVEE